MAGFIGDIEFLVSEVPEYGSVERSVWIFLGEEFFASVGGVEAF